MEVRGIARSPIRWAGSKRRLVPQLRALAPPKFRNYIEPFCGSMCFLIALQPKWAIVGDINEELIHFYRMIRWRPSIVSRHASQWDTAAQTYYRVRSTPIPSLSAEERAARFLYLNRYSFNGVYRTNGKGDFNVPRGSHTGALPRVEELTGFGRTLRRVELNCCDFGSLVDRAGRDDFIYLDPPYVGRGVRDRGEYGKDSFKAPDLDRLSDTLHAAAARGARVLLSYADIPAVRKTFSGWDVTAVSVARNVSGFARGRGFANEVLIRNYQ